MVDRTVERSAEEKKELYRQGSDRPRNREGYVWRPERGKDPTKDPKAISGWRGIPLPKEPVDEFVWPSEIPPEKRVAQSHFMDVVDKASEANKKPGD